MQGHEEGLGQDKVRAERVCFLPMQRSSGLMPCKQWWMGVLG